MVSASIKFGVRHLFLMVKVTVMGQGMHYVNECHQKDRRSSDDTVPYLHGHPSQQVAE